MRGQRLGWHRRVAQVVVVVDHGHDARTHGHAVQHHALGVTGGIGMLVVLGNDQQGAGRQSHATALHQAMGHVLAVGFEFGHAEVVVRQTQTVGQRHLAHVVQQGANAQVRQVGRHQIEGAAQQHGNDGHVHGVRGVAVARRLAQHPHAELFVHQHLVQQGLGELLGTIAGLLRLAHHGVVHAAQVAAGLAVLALAQAQRLGLLGQLAGAILLGTLGRAHVLPRRGHLHGRQVGADQALGGLRRCNQQCIAAIRAPAQLLQAQATDGGNLVRRGDLEAGQGKGMRHPAHVQMHKHPHSQIVQLYRDRHDAFPVTRPLRCGFLCSDG